MSDQAARLTALQADRSILLQAPAGSGKTTVLAQRFLSVLAQVDEPEEVLAMTFTRKAAAEMRERVLLALEDRLPENQPDLEHWRQLRRKVLAQAQARGWAIEELATRIRIQTIDSLGHEIARAMPLLGRMQSTLAVVDDATPLYIQAAQQTLRHADGDPEYQYAVDVLLQRIDNNWNRAQSLLAELLASRNRWQPILLASNPEQLVDRMLASLERIVTETLRKTVDVLPGNLLNEAAQLARAVAVNRNTTGHTDDGVWSSWLVPEAALDLAPQSLYAWQAVVGLALKDDGEWRGQVTVIHGFPKEEKKLKERWREWLHELQQQTGAQQLLRNIAALPHPSVDAGERTALAALARLMLLAAAHLKLVFRATGHVDHSEVSAVARQALRQMGEPTEFSIRQTLRIRHLLVDEFQDTSPEQLELVKELIHGWDPHERRSLFLVGDPMQSIYLFRNSEVGLFLQTRVEGVGEIALESLHLERNFRSLPALVDWSNMAFPHIFPRMEDVRSSAVTFLASQPARAPQATAEPAVTVWPQATAAPEPEAIAIAAEIARLRQEDAALTIAVLVQTRALAPLILQALRRAGVAALGVDLASLAERTVIRDLVAIGQALLHAGDRSAWLSVLRSPCCGLTLDDLHRLCGTDHAALIVERLADAQIHQSLSPDGQQRLQRIAPLLLQAWHRRSSADLATAIETLWRQLGGPAACRDAADIDAATQYLLALRRTGEADLGLDSVRLQGLAEKLRDRGGADGDNPVEILTIHHAKGLEWDVVFVPGLGRVPRGDNPPLLRWLQLPAPQAESDLLLAVRSIGEASSSDPLGRFIKQLQAERQDNERVRLAYVAVTRARRRLYLSGHAPFKNKEQARVPRTRSQLHILWPALRQHFEHVVLPSKPVATDAEVTTAGTAIAITAPWYRLPADFSPVQTRRLPQVLGLTSSSTEPASAPEFNWVGPLARAAGTVVHAELERLAATTQPLDTNFTARTAAYATRLRELGVAETQASDMAQVIARQMQQLVRDPHARWLLATEHRGACSELRLSGIVAGELRNVVIDRSFVDTDGVRWVIDYKTSSHKGGGLEEFLESELLRYRPQLQLYVALAQRLGPEPVRAALYFPWLGELREMRIT